MSSRRAWFPWLAVVSCLSLPTGAGAQGAPSVEIRLADTETARALDPIEFSAVVSLPGSPNQAKPATATAIAAEPETATESGSRMTITGLSVKPTGMLAADYAPAADCQFQEQGLDADQRIEVPCMLYPKSSGIREKLFPSVSAVFAKSLLLQTQVDYIQQDDQKEHTAVSRVLVLPPLVAVFYGGMVGALLLALFRGLAPFRHGLAGGPPRLPATRREFYQWTMYRGVLMARTLMVTVAWLVLGGISAIMIIILTKASSGELSPVQIEIKDFVGGVLVGLLSFPVVDWLERRLVASEDTAPPPAPKADSAPAG